MRPHRKSSNHGIDPADRVYTLAEVAGRFRFEAPWARDSPLRNQTWVSESDHSKKLIRLDGAGVDAPGSAIGDCVHPQDSQAQQHFCARTDMTV
jgi:hypothetical protein